MRPFILFVAGLVFGVGLYISGMNQPSKVQGFLDISGHWDPIARLRHGRRGGRRARGVFRRETA